MISFLDLPPDEAVRAKGFYLWEKLDQPVGRSIFSAKSFKPTGTQVRMETLNGAVTVITQCTKHL